MLPAQAAADAVRSLRDSLVMVVTLPASAVTGFSQVKMIHSENADIYFYFRSVDGEAELLRVLPVELEDVAASRSPSASASHHSLHR